MKHTSPTYSVNLDLSIWASLWLETASVFSKQQLPHFCLKSIIKVLLCCSCRRWINVVCWQCFLTSNFHLHKLNPKTCVGLEKTFLTGLSLSWQVSILLLYYIQSIYHLYKDIWHANLYICDALTCSKKKSQLLFKLMKWKRQMHLLVTVTFI